VLRNVTLAEDILKYEFTESLLIFLPKWVPKSETCLEKVPKLVYCWHEHGVHANLAEKHRNVGNSWGQVKMTSLLSLARVACRNKPLDILIQHQPPELLPKI